jgi:hypothetical protein
MNALDMRANAIGFTDSERVQRKLGSLPSEAAAPIEKERS